jgi:hydroxypyruvate isomerase
MLRFAANLTFLYGEYAFPDRFAAAANDGFTAVEYLFPYDYPAEQLAGWLREHGLRQVLFNAPPGDWAAGDRGLASLVGREEEFRGAMSKAFEYAQGLQCPQVHVMAGVGPSAKRETYVRNLRWAAKVAADLGIGLLIEPINTRDMPGYFLNRQDEAHAIVDEVGSPALKVQMDLYHCQIVEGDLSVKLRKYLPRDVGHIQIASVPARNEPDDGELNYDYVFGVIEEVGFDGWIGCEYRPRADTSGGLGWMKKRS